MRQQRLRIGFQVTGSPGARLRERSIERVPHDHHLTAIELAHPCRHDMHVHLALASGPAEFHIVAGLQLPSIVRETLPPPAAWIRRGIDAQPAIAFDARRDLEVTLPRRTPKAFGTVPTVQQDMRHAAYYRLKRANTRFHQLDQAFEGNFFRFAHRLLPIQLRSQGTAMSHQRLHLFPKVLHPLLSHCLSVPRCLCQKAAQPCQTPWEDRKSTRLNSSHMSISYAV